MPFKPGHIDGCNQSTTAGGVKALKAQGHEGYVASMLRSEAVATIRTRSCLTNAGLAFTTRSRYDIQAPKRV